MPRHGTEDLITNRNEFYEEFFEARGVDRIRHYRSPMLPPITVDVIRSLQERNMFGNSEINTIKSQQEHMAILSYGGPSLGLIKNQQKTM